MSRPKPKIARTPILHTSLFLFRFSFPLEIFESDLRRVARRDGRALRRARALRARRRALHPRILLLQGGPRGHDQKHGDGAPRGAAPGGAGRAARGLRLQRPAVRLAPRAAER